MRKTPLTFRLTAEQQRNSCFVAYLADLERSANAGEMSEVTAKRHRTEVWRLLASQKSSADVPSQLDQLILQHCARMRQKFGANVVRPIKSSLKHFADWAHREGFSASDTSQLRAPQQGWYAGVTLPMVEQFLRETGATKKKIQTMRGNLRKLLHIALESWKPVAATYVPVIDSAKEAAYWNSLLSCSDADSPLIAAPAEGSETLTEYLLANFDSVATSLTERLHQTSAQKPRRAGSVIGCVRKFAAWLESKLGRSFAAVRMKNPCVVRNSKLKGTYRTPTLPVLELFYREEFPENVERARARERFRGLVVSLMSQTQFSAEHEEEALDAFLRSMKRALRAGETRQFPPADLPQHLLTTATAQLFANVKSVRPRYIRETCRAGSRTPSRRRVSAALFRKLYNWSNRRLGSQVDVRQFKRRLDYRQIKER